MIEKYNVSKTGRGWEKRKKGDIVGGKIALRRVCVVHFMPKTQL